MVGGLGYVPKFTQGDIRRQLVGIGCLLLRMYQGLNSGPLVWQQALLLSEPSHQPRKLETLGKI